MEVKELRIGNLIFNHKQEIIVVNGEGKTEAVTQRIVKAML